MKKMILAVITITCLSGCSTHYYNRQATKESEYVNPYSQEQVPDYGIANTVRSIINR